MVRTDGLNPIVVKVLTNLHYRYSNETPKMWCSRIRVPFKKLIGYNSKFFSKHEFIHMTERSYKDGEFRPGGRTFHIYCTACDSLVFICENTENCANKHLNECIAKIEKRRVMHYRSILWKRKINRALSSKNEINKLYNNNSYYLNHTFRISLNGCDELQAVAIKKEIVVRITNSAIAIQRAWRAFKLGPETWAKRVWNIVRNDGTPDRKKYLGILSTRERKINPQTREEYALFIDEHVNNYKRAYSENLAQKYIKEFLAERATGYEEYKYYYPNDWAEMKKYHLNKRLNAVAYIVTFIKFHQQGYRFVAYGDWSFMLKCLANPERHRIGKVCNNIVVCFVKSSEYARYVCKKAGKAFPCDSLEIDYFKSGEFPIEGKHNSIDFSDLNNNCEYVQRVFQTIDSLFK
ncbi:hypothetical protein RclHR1_05140024 [Rhizophagus clarus]|uniref:Uncharacterized protein n=1 Tax=Rhizophagus clarus TaxID=94130 RepID=A0A2Z6S333_9GLOM|nr:hypothetical protein RclHR1_05140024 [Rhizophagus clarus]